MSTLVRSRLKRQPLLQKGLPGGAIATRLFERLSLSLRSTRNSVIVVEFKAPLMAYCIGKAELVLMFVGRPPSLPRTRS